MKAICKKIVDIITRDVGTGDLKDAVNKLIPDAPGQDIERACQSIYPLHDVFIRKFKVLKEPKFDLGKLMDMHGEGASHIPATTWLQINGQLYGILLGLPSALDCPTTGTSGDYDVPRRP